MKLIKTHDQPSSTPTLLTSLLNSLRDQNGLNNHGC